jgi:hypothetical protein
MGGVCVALMAGCGGGSSPQGDFAVAAADMTMDNSIVLSGVLSGGPVTFSHRSGPASPSPDAVPNGPLAGYQLYCVTFAMPAVAGSGTADASGAVTVSVAAANTPFGCFVLDTSGAAVATVIFATGATTGQTVTLAGSTNLGTITVDGSSGVAKATLTTGTIAPAASTCPSGTWTLGDGTSSCGASYATVWVAATPGGKYLASFTDGPKLIAATTCGYGSLGIDNAATYANGVLTLKIPDTGRPGCNSFLTLTGTPDASCKTMALTASLDNCGPCKSGKADCTGCGTNTCTATNPGVTKQ